MTRFKRIKKVIIFILCLLQIFNISYISLQAIPNIEYQNKNIEKNYNFKENETNKKESYEDLEEVEIDQEEYKYKKEKELSLNTKKTISGEPVVTFDSNTGILRTEFDGEAIESLVSIVLTKEQVSIDNILSKGFIRAYTIGAQEELNIHIQGNLEGLGTRPISLSTDSLLTQNIFVTIFDDTTKFETSKNSKYSLLDNYSLINGGITSSELDNIRNNNPRFDPSNTSISTDTIHLEGNRYLTVSFSLGWLFTEQITTNQWDDMYTSDTYKNFFVDYFFNVIPNSFFEFLIYNNEDIEYGYAYGNSLNLPNGNVTTLSQEEFVELLDLDFGKEINFKNQPNTANLGVAFINIGQLIQNLGLDVPEDFSKQRPFKEFFQVVIQGEDHETFNLEIQANDFEIYTSEFKGETLTYDEIIKHSKAKVFLDSSILNNYIEIIGYVNKYPYIYDILLETEHENETAYKLIYVTVKDDNKGIPEIPETPKIPEIPGYGESKALKTRHLNTPSFENVPIVVENNREIKEKIEEEIENKDIKRHEVKMQIGNKTMFINSSSKEMDVAPYIKNNRTMVPIRFLSYALSIPKENIHWDENKNLVTIIDGSTIIEIIVGEELMYVNKKPVNLGKSDLDTLVAEIKFNRVFVPIRPIAEVFDVNLKWVEETQTVKLFK